MHCIENRNEEGKRILDFAVVNNLCIKNTSYEHRKSPKWTWYRWNNQRQEQTDKSMIDLFPTNHTNIITDVKAVPFILFMDSCVRDIGAAENSVEILMYADDVAVIANSIEEMQSVANSSYEGTKQNGMKINTRMGKTEFMVISRNLDHYDVFVGQDEINQLDTYNYLC